MATIGGFATLLALCAAVVDASSVTPVEKVTELLSDLSKTIEKEGKAEAVAYDKYACFCKEQADGKQYAIEKSTEKIGHLTDVIGKLTTEISDLDARIQHLGEEASRLDVAMEQKKNARDSAHATFVTEVADATGALDAVGRAIQALEDSKKAQVGKAELEAAAFAQVGKVAKAALSRRAGLSAPDVGRLTFLASAGEPGTAYTYKYKSNDIIATLENLRTTFAKRKSSLEDDEFRALSAYELTQQDLLNQKKFALKEKREKEQVRESKAEEKEMTEQDKSNEQADKVSDSAFMNVLQGDCEEKARLWDQRSQARSSELTAISEAIGSLRSGVAPNWQANKKLVGLQTTNAGKGHWVYVDDSLPAKPMLASMSFLQVRGTSLRGSTKSRSIRVGLHLSERVYESLTRSAAQLRSPFLSVAALKVRAAEDHFVKVRQIIKDLLERLNDQASDEEDHKTFCDRETSNAVEKRDQQQMTVEDLKAQIDQKESSKVQLKSEIAELSKQIAANKKALNEATQLRQEENADNTKTVEEARSGLDSVVFAITRLNEFYQGQQAAMIQRSGYVPPNSDREGLTVGDRAPDVFDSEYKGSQEASKGIIGILEVIRSDFERTETVVSQQEIDAQEKFEGYEQANTDDTGVKQNSVSTKEDEVSGITDDLVGLNDSLGTAQKSHKDANSELEKLHSMCIEGEETYQERVAKRNKEIEALKEAHNILEDWQK